MSVISIARALLSVKNKAMIEELTKGLLAFGVELIADEQTSEKLKKSHVKHQSVSSFSSEIEPNSLVVCNFYSFNDALEKNIPEDELSSYIDLEGPSLLRAAAKNYKHVLVLCDPADYLEVMNEIRSLGGCVSIETRKRMMLKALEMAYEYDKMVWSGFARKKLKKGKNAHDQAYLASFLSDHFFDFTPLENPVTKTVPEISWHNVRDVSSTYQFLQEVRDVVAQNHAVVAVVKHGHPCGAATGLDLEKLIALAWEGDPENSFGGTIGFTSPVTIECARFLSKIPVDTILAPRFEDGVAFELSRQNKKIRLFEIKSFSMIPKKEMLSVCGGVLIGDADLLVREEFKLVTKKKFSDSLKNAANVAILVAKYLPSCAVAITRCHDDETIDLVSAGYGQPSRYDSIELLAGPRFKNKNILNQSKHLVLASDSYFPSRNCIDAIAKMGLNFVVQPGGSQADADVTKACDELGVSMVFTGRSHFKA